jgi:hypothetical protein
MTPQNPGTRRHVRPDEAPELQMGDQAGGEHILVSDDNFDMRSYIGRFLGAH